MGRESTESKLEFATFANGIRKFLRICTIISKCMLNTNFPPLGAQTHQLYFKMCLRQ